jgi:hypothetical protein
VSEDLKARILADAAATPGVLVVSAIHGLGGIGKSTLAAALTHDEEVQQRFPDGILWATLGQQPDVLSLLVGWIQALRDYDFRPTTVEAASAQLRTLLHNKAALLVVDDAWDPAHVRPLLAGGHKARVLVTTREAIIAQVVGATLYDLDVMTPEQAIALLVRRMGRDLEGAKRKQALALAKTVGYLPLALELAAAQVSDGVPWAELLADLQAEIARLETLDMPGAEEITDEATRKRLSLRASFHLSLRRLPSERRRAFAWLGVLSEDATLTLAMAATLWEMQVQRARETLRYLRDKALLLSGVPEPDGTLTYRLHDLLHDLARRLLTDPPTPENEGDLPGFGLTLPSAHAALLERYQARTQDSLWHTLPDDGYIYAHLTWHLEQAVWVAELHALLGEKTIEDRNGWYQTRERLGQTAGYLRDVARASRLAEERSAISLQCRYAFITASLSSLAKNIPPVLLVALVEQGMWTPVQGLAYAQQVPELGQRAIALAGLVPHLPQVERAEAMREALAAAQASRDAERRAIALAGLAPHLPQAERAEAMREALATAQAIGKAATRNTSYYDWAEPARGKVATRNTFHYDWAEILVGLAPHLPEAERAEAMREALATARAAARTIKSEGWRAVVLARLASHLPDAERTEALWDALYAARRTEDEDDRTELLARLAPHLPEAKRAQVLQEALAATPAIKSRERRAAVLARLASHLPDAERTEALREALAVVRAIGDRDDRAEALLELASHPLKAECAEPLREALAVAQAFESREAQARALAELIPHLPEAERAEALREALVAAQAIWYRDVRAEALAKLALRLAELGHPQEALAVARTIENEWLRAKVLTRLPPRLAELNYPQEALAVARAIQYSSDRAKALTGLAPLVPEAERAEVLREALAAARAIELWRGRTKALTELVPLVPEVEHAKVLQEALAAARAIGWERKRAEALAGLAPHLPETERTEALREALHAARAIEDEDDRAEALAELAPHLPEALLQEALAAARTIGRGSKRVKVLTRLPPPHLPEALLQEALAAAQEIGDASDRAKVLARLAPLAPEAERAGVLQEALAAARAIKREWRRAWTWAELAPHLPEALLQEALAAAQKIVDANDRAKVLARLAPRLAELGHPQEALAVAGKIRQERKRAEALIELVPHLPEVLLGEALAAAQKIGDPNDRAKVLAGLAPHLPEAERAEVLGEALAAAQKIGDPNDRAKVLAGLAPHLPEAERAEVLGETLAAAREIGDANDRAKVLARLAPHLAHQFPHQHLYSLWQETLPILAARTRKDLLADLCALELVIAALGGAEAVVETFHAIQDVGRWWP